MKQNPYIKKRIKKIQIMQTNIPYNSLYIIEKQYKLEFSS